MNKSHEWSIPVTLNEEGRVSSLIKKLKEEFSKETLDSFWKTVEQQGTPLFEPIPGNDAEMLVTFVWRAKKEHKNVVVASYGLASFDPFKNQMTHIPNTDVWYKSWILPKTARTVYSISPDDPLISLSDYRLDRCNFTSFVQSWVQDPLNPKKYHIPGYLCMGEKAKEMSLLEMPGAPKFPWLNETRSYAQGTVSKCHIPSTTFENGRDVYLYLPPHYDPKQSNECSLVVAFDGRGFKELMNGPAIFDYLIAHKKIPPTIVVMVLNPDPNTVTRARDLAANAPFSNYIANDLIPWMRKNYRVTSDPHQTVVTGASLGGFASAYLGLTRPEIFGNVLAQSGAYWWRINGEQDWILRQFAESPKHDVRFFLDVGILETVPTFVDGLSFVNGTRYLRDILKAKGYPVKYVEFAGGHDYICWQETFAQGIEHLLGSR